MTSATGLAYRAQSVLALALEVEHGAPVRDSEETHDECLISYQSRPAYLILKSVSERLRIRKR